VDALWTWVNADILTGGVIGGFLGAFLAVFANGLIVPWLFKRVTGGAKRERDERKKEARKRELLHRIRERSSGSEVSYDAFPTTLELDEGLRSKKKLRSKEVLDTYELLRELEAEERIRPVRPAGSQGVPDVKEMRWRYVFFRESPTVRGGGIETHQLVQQLFHIKKQAKVLEERMVAFEALKGEIDRIGETLERIEKQVQPAELRQLLEEVHETLKGAAAPAEPPTPSSEAERRTG
jgi:hypothetical protein